jgi:hypothetical protein
MSVIFWESNNLFKFQGEWSQYGTKGALQDLFPKELGFNLKFYQNKNLPTQQ